MSSAVDTSVGDWIIEQYQKMTPEQRQKCADIGEALEERQAIVDESREAERAARGQKPPETLDRVEEWIRDMYPRPEKMGRSWEDMSAADRAIFTSVLMQPDKKLDDAIAKYAPRELDVRRVFKKVGS